MIPCKLTLEGLYSYQARQTIDFTSLTQAGLFGVFGSVGSGKSSILEAVTFALFGKTERLNERGDSRNYNMMNLKSDRTYIEFDFHNFENRYFRITREYRRHKSKFRDVLLETPVLYEQIDGQWIPLDHTDVEPLIGLSYTNFKRTIIIPQGQFKEFLELGNRDRTQMMKEIFNLHRFDLQDQVRNLTKKNQSQLDTLRGQLSNYDTVNEETIQNLRAQLAIETTDLQQSETRLKDLDSHYLAQTKLKEDLAELAKAKSELAEVLSKEMEMRELKNRLVVYESTHKAFYQLLIDRKRVAREIDSLELEKQQHQDKYKELQNKRGVLQDRYEKLKILYDQLDVKKDEANDLKILTKLVELTNNEELKIKDINNEQAKATSVEKELQSLQDLLKSQTTELAGLRTSKLDNSVLMQVSNWFTTQHSLQKALRQAQTDVQDIETALRQIEQELQPYGQDTERLIAEKETEISTLRDKYTAADVQRQIATYAHSLEEGKPCPLCGSLEHQPVHDHQDYDAEIAAINRFIDEANNTIKAYRQQLINKQSLQERRKILLEQLAKERKAMEDIGEQIASHQKGFEWAGFNPEDQAHFEAQREQNLRIEEAIRNKEKEIDSSRSTIENKNIKLNNLYNNLNKIKLEAGQIFGQIQSGKSHLRRLQFDDYAAYDSKLLTQKHSDITTYIQQTESQFAELTEALTKVQSSLVSEESFLTAVSRQIDDQQKELSTIQATVDEALLTHGFDHVEAVRTILAQQLDVDATREMIEQYHIKLGSLRSIVQRLEKNLATAVFDEEAYALLAEQLESVRKEVKKLTEIVAQRQAELQRISRQLDEKKQLLETQQALQKRADNLTVMMRLFKAQGFVEYVSSIYLRQLCDQANVRFRRMTRNQLSLTVNEENDFEIIDYLNEGRSRNVKTLSGGQAFQVSLSLALALAESVQSQSKANRNFFFIDEGFGTQDSESVNMVFETLLSLQKENRIVGIISHVEELKERIPAAIHINKDEEKGSVITMVSS